MLPLHHSHHESGTGTTGLEPATSRLTSECSSRLSYAPWIALNLGNADSSIVPDKKGGLREPWFQLQDPRAARQ